MKEFVVVFNAQITVINTGNSNEEAAIVRFDAEKQKLLETAIKMVLAADDVKVSDYKVFINEKDEALIAEV